MSIIDYRFQKGKFLWVLVISILVLCFSLNSLNASAASDYPKIGIGGKFIPIVFDQKAFFPNLSGNLGRFGAEFGGNSVNFQTDEEYSYNSLTYSMNTSASAGFYIANLQYYFRTNNLVRPYIGAGFVNVGLNGEGEVDRDYEEDSAYGGDRKQEFDISSKMGGYNFTFGLELPLKKWNIPLVLVAGINHYRFNNLDVNALMKSSYNGGEEIHTHENKIEESFTYSLSLFHYNFGIRYEF